MKEAKGLIPYSKPVLSQDQEGVLLQEVLESGCLVMGKQVRAFETSLASFTNRKHAIAVSSGTTALQLALTAVGVTSDWSVIVPAYTWVATYNVAYWLGAEVILMDVDPETYCLDPKDFERAYRACTRKKKAIMPVHMFGYRVDPNWLKKIESETGITIVGDGCCAFGGLDRGQRCGAWTELECLSFHPRKVITTGEGGLVLTDNDEIADRVRRLRDHGAVRSVEQNRQVMQGGLEVPRFPEPGHNFRMTDLQGAIGNAQMAKVDDLIMRRVEIAEIYDQMIPKLCKVSQCDDTYQWLKTPPNITSGGSMRVLTFYPVGVDLPESMEHYLPKFLTELVAQLSQEQIVVRTPMTNLYQLEYTESAKAGYHFPGTQKVISRTLGLPFFPDLNTEQIERVVRTLAKVGNQLLQDFWPDLQLLSP